MRHCRYLAGRLGAASAASELTLAKKVADEASQAKSQFLAHIVKSSAVATIDERVTHIAATRMTLKMFIGRSLFRPPKSLSHWGNLGKVTATGLPERVFMNCTKSFFS
jgi:hypothetical protein